MLQLSPKLQHVSKFDHLRDEITEIVMRMSEGDCASIHVEAALTQLERWDQELGKGEVVAHVNRLGIAPEGLDRGILALAIYHGMLKNGREERLDFVASLTGALPSAVSKAEKLLETGRAYMNSDSAIAKVVNRLELPVHWGREIAAISAVAAASGFASLEIIVSSVTVALAKQVNMLTKNQREVRKKLRPYLRKMTATALRTTLGVSGSAIRRAFLKLDVSATRKIESVAQVLLRFKDE